MLMLEKEWQEAQKLKGEEERHNVYLGGSGPKNISNIFD